MHLSIVLEVAGLFIFARMFLQNLPVLVSEYRFYRSKTWNFDQDSDHSGSAYEGDIIGTQNSSKRPLRNRTRVLVLLPFVVFMSGLATITLCIHLIQIWI